MDKIMNEMQSNEVNEAGNEDEYTPLALFF